MIDKETIERLSMELSNYAQHGVAEMCRLLRSQGLDLDRIGIAMVLFDVDGGPSGAATSVSSKLTSQVLAQMAASMSEDQGRPVVVALDNKLDS